MFLDEMSFFVPRSLRCRYLSVVHTSPLWVYGLWYLLILWLISPVHYAMMCEKEDAMGFLIEHGESGVNETKEYRAWCGMKQRCCNPKFVQYEDYGGRGITICERWNDYASFLEDMGRTPSPEHSLDRIDNDGNYGPTNCRWATASEQSNNQRTNSLLTINGETKNVSQWSQITGIHRETIYRRIRHGLSDEECIQPVEKPLCLTINGETKTHGEWAQIAGINRETIYRRIKMGWTSEDCIQPVGYRRP